MMPQKLRILSNSAKFSTGQPLRAAYNFSVTVAHTSSTYRLEAVASLKFLATENMPRNAVKLRIVDCAEGGSRGNATGYCQQTV